MTHFMQAWCQTRRAQRRCHGNATNTQTDSCVCGANRSKVLIVCEDMTFRGTAANTTDIQNNTALSFYELIYNISGHKGLTKVTAWQRK